jgi:hypothetical protein
MSELRTEMFGERGGATMARRLGLPLRTWYNYEVGTAIPAEVVLRVIEMTSVESDWLLNGNEPKYRLTTPEKGDERRPSALMAHALVKEALELLERGKSARE